MPAKQAQKSSSKKTTSSKSNWRQFDENRYKKMSDGKFVKAFKNLSLNNS